MVPILILLSLWPHITVDAALIDFGISNEDPNQLFFECYVGEELMLQAGATYDFFNTLEDAAANRPQERIMEENFRLLFTIDPSREAYVRCSYEADVSSLLAIAGKLWATLITSVGGYSVPLDNIT